MAKLYNYINFDNCQEAVAYYEEVFHATSWVSIPMSPEMAEQTGMDIDLEKSTVHGQFSIYGQIIMCSDSFRAKAEFSKMQNMFLDFNTEDEADMAELDALYGRITSHPDTVIDMPLADQFWGGKMGIIVDKFGITWMLHAQPFSKLGL